MIAERTTTEDHGKVYGFNLVYSGNHYEGVEVGNHDLIRVMTGINPHCFEWKLEKDEEFETPEAVMTFSCAGLNGASGHFHDFINNHIVRGDFKGKERPVLYNSWEACFFKFTQGGLVRLAKRAKALGVELFVMDDGWFGKRNSDKTSLGDWTANRRKFHRGLSPFIRKINRMGMTFGIWIEPEMVNEDSDLFRAHPEYAVRLPGRSPCYGRNQLVLDLCSPEVRDYLVKSIRSLLDSNPISYVKWDMNRHVTDMYSASLGESQGAFFHRYVLGLYDILTRIFAGKPQILLESCSSGGNRFDLGMLCHSPQIWASDDTDPAERLKIQTGLSYFYPLSTIGAHVSHAPHQQTLRSTTLPARFHMACFGDLGYEMDLKFLSFAEKKEIRKQVDFYKEHRLVLQYGRLYRFDAKKANRTDLLCVSKDRSKAVSGHFQTISTASESNDILPLCGLDVEKKYSLRTFPVGISIKRFGALINFLLPVKLPPESFLIRLADRFYRLPDCVEKYEGTGSLFHAGIRLNNQFMGSWYNNQTRLVGDFGSHLYIIEEKSGT
jgi:alpha-galactosidase